jgi:hypothetical protein
MNKIVNTYIMQSIGLIALLTLITLACVWAWGNVGMVAGPLALVVVFQLVACVAYGLVWKSVARTSLASLPTLYMAASAIRMFAAIVVVVGFLFLVSNKEAVRFFIITFLIYYFLILIYDTVYFVKVEKKIQQNG